MGFKGVYSGVQGGIKWGSRGYIVGFKGVYISRTCYPDVLTCIFI